MRITPLDVRKQDFRKAVRGYETDEVRAFLSTLADEYETVLVDNKQLRETIMGQDEKLGEYRKIENTLRDTLMTAERMVQETKENAAREGELIVREAHLKARQILEECRVRTEELRREMAGLRQEKQAYLGRFKALAQAQIQFVEAHQADFEDMDRRMLDMVDSVLGGVGPAGAPQPTIPVAAPAAAAPPAAAAAPAPRPRAADQPYGPAPRPAQPEVDRWRDYQPVAAAKPAAPTPLTIVPPAAMPPQADPAEEILATIAHLEPVQGQAAGRQPAGNPYEAAAEAELATLGIQVPPLSPARSQEPVAGVPV